MRHLNRLERFNLSAAIVGLIADIIGLSGLIIGFISLPNRQGSISPASSLGFFIAVVFFLLSSIQHSLLWCS